MNKEENTAWGLPYDHANPNAEINAEIDAAIEAELLRDLLDVAAVQRCEGLTAPETYEVLQDEPSDELMARLKAIVKKVVVKREPKVDVEILDLDIGAFATNLDFLDEEQD